MPFPLGRCTTCGEMWLTKTNPHSCAKVMFEKQKKKKSEEKSARKHAQNNDKLKRNNK